VSIRTFLIEPSEFVQYTVVRMGRDGQCSMGAPGFSCAAHGTVFEGNVNDERLAELRATAYDTAALWPEACDRCGRKFTPGDDIRSTGERTVYTNAERTWFGPLNAAPAGAMWWATWMDDFLHHQLDHVLVVNTPGGDWTPDDRASNCTMPEDREHFCWVLHGPLESVTTDKNGNTCGAGAGSIAQPGYHGFLRNGFLERA
jgi:hypothetical protein